MKSIYFPYVDEFDQPIERDPHQYPHSYNSFVIWRGGPNSESTGTIYSDHLFREDSKKYGALSMKHFGNDGQIFCERRPEQIEAFLREWIEDPTLKLILVVQCCNQSNGNPLWRFDYHSNRI